MDCRASAFAEVYPERLQGSRRARKDEGSQRNVTQTLSSERLGHFGILIIALNQLDQMPIIMIPRMKSGHEIRQPGWQNPRQHAGLCEHEPQDLEVGAPARNAVLSQKQFGAFEPTWPKFDGHNQHQQ